jgi:site-specific DNA-methyltransferase (adenine-specific)
MTDIKNDYYTLMQGDCLERMKEIRDDSVDMVMCDPPYGTTACAWDAVIPFEPMWVELKRVLKTKSAVVLCGSEPFSSVLRCSNLTNYKYDWVWVKRPVNFLNAKKQPLRKTERVSVFYGGTYNPQNLIPNKKINKRSCSTETNREHGLSNISEFSNYPTDVLEFIGERGCHPTQKPVALMEYLIRTYTNEDQTVLDFTMGSGTTGVAAMNQKRKFIGIERDDKYFAIAAKRIEDAFNQSVYSIL